LSTVCLSMYSITENIYCSRLSSVAIHLQPEPNCFTSYNTRKGLCSVSLCAIVLRSPPPSHVSTSNGQRSSQLFCVDYTGGWVGVLWLSSVPVDKSPVMIEWLPFYFVVGRSWVEMPSLKPSAFTEEFYGFLSPLGK
jgi:hypothetical protein